MCGWGVFCVAFNNNLYAMSFSFPQQHLDALLLSVASSTDNFTVGVSVGINQKDLPFWMNACITVCNATGAWIAGYGGVMVSTSLPFLAPLLAAIAFGYLALQEMVTYYYRRKSTRLVGGDTSDSTSGSSSRRNKKGQQHQQPSQVSSMTNESPADLSSVIRLAIPMTLNNLAGGVAGGAAGLSPIITAFYALLASFVMMSLGYTIGKRLGRKLPMDPSFVSGLLLGTLCFLTIQDTLSSSSSS